MTNHVLALPGAFSTPMIFNYLAAGCCEYEWHYFHYGSTGTSVWQIVDDICAQFDTTDQEFHVVGHSMGGLLGLAISHLPWIKSVSTIATPLGGLDLNFFQKYWSGSRFLIDIERHGDFISSIHQKHHYAKIQHLITTKGFNPYVYEPNDGVVTVKSQTNWHIGECHEVASNHSEVMLNPQTVRLLKTFWQKTS